MPNTYFITCCAGIGSVSCGEINSEECSETGSVSVRKTDRHIKTKTKTKKEISDDISCAERLEHPSTPPLITLPLNDGTEYPLTDEEAQEWAGLYPAVDVKQQLRAMRGWLVANPRQRKTIGGVKRFINGWLAKEQNRSRLPKSGEGSVNDDYWKL